MDDRGHAENDLIGATFGEQRENIADLHRGLDAFRTRLTRASQDFKTMSHQRELDPAYMLNVSTENMDPHPNTVCFFPRTHQSMSADRPSRPSHRRHIGLRKSNYTRTQFATSSAFADATNQPTHSTPPTTWSDDDECLIQPAIPDARARRSRSQSANRNRKAQRQRSISVTDHRSRSRPSEAPAVTTVRSSATSTSGVASGGSATSSGHQTQRIKSAAPARRSSAEAERIRQKLLEKRIEKIRISHGIRTAGIRNSPGKEPPKALNRQSPSSIRATSIDRPEKATRSKRMPNVPSIGSPSAIPSKAVIQRTIATDTVMKPRRPFKRPPAASFGSDGGLGFIPLHDNNDGVTEKPVNVSSQISPTANGINSNVSTRPNNLDKAGKTREYYELRLRGNNGLDPQNLFDHWSPLRLRRTHLPAPSPPSHFPATLATRHVPVSASKIPRPDYSISSPRQEIARQSASRSSFTGMNSVQVQTDIIGDENSGGRIANLLDLSAIEAEKPKETSTPMKPSTSHHGPPRSAERPFAPLSLDEDDEHRRLASFQPPVGNYVLPPGETPLLEKTPKRVSDRYNRPVEKSPAEANEEFFTPDTAPIDRDREKFYSPEVNFEDASDVLFEQRLNRSLQDVDRTLRRTIGPVDSSLERANASYGRTGDFLETPIRRSSTLLHSPGRLNLNGRDERRSSGSPFAEESNRIDRPLRAAIDILNDSLSESTAYSATSDEAQAAAAAATADAASQLKAFEQRYQDRRASSLFRDTPQWENVEGGHNERRLETCTKAASAPSVAMEREEQRNLSELSVRTVTIRRSFVDDDQLRDGRAEILQKRIDALKNYVRARITLLHLRKKLIAKTKSNMNERLADLDAQLRKLEMEFPVEKKRIREMLNEPITQAEFMDIQSREIKLIQLATSEQLEEWATLEAAANSGKMGPGLLDLPASSKASGFDFQFAANKASRDPNPPLLECLDHRRVTADSLKRLNRHLHGRERTVKKLERQAIRVLRHQQHEIVHEVSTSDTQPTSSVDEQQSDDLHTSTTTVSSCDRRQWKTSIRCSTGQRQLKSVESCDSDANEQLKTVLGEREERVAVLRESLAEKRQKASKLKRELRRRSLEHVESEERSVQAQIDAYDRYIDQTEKHIEEIATLDRAGTPPVIVTGRSLFDSIDGSLLASRRLSLLAPKQGIPFVPAEQNLPATSRSFGTEAGFRQTPRLSDIGHRSSISGAVDAPESGRLSTSGRSKSVSTAISTSSTISEAVRTEDEQEAEEEGSTTIEEELPTSGSRGMEETMDSSREDTVTEEDELIKAIADDEPEDKTDQPELIEPALDLTSTFNGSLLEDATPPPPSRMQEEEGRPPSAILSDRFGYDELPTVTPPADAVTETDNWRLPVKLHSFESMQNMDDIIPADPGHAAKSPIVQETVTELSEHLSALKLETNRAGNVSRVADSLFEEVLKDAVSNLMTEQKNTSEIVENREEKGSSSSDEESTQNSAKPIKLIETNEANADRFLNEVFDSLLQETLTDALAVIGKIKEKSIVPNENEQPTPRPRTPTSPGQSPRSPTRFMTVAVKSPRRSKIPQPKSRNAENVVKSIFEEALSESLEIGLKSIGPTTSTPSPEKSFSPDKTIPQLDLSSLNLSSLDDDLEQSNLTVEAASRNENARKYAVSGELPKKIVQDDTIAPRIKTPSPPRMAKPAIVPSLVPVAQPEIEIRLVKYSNLLWTAMENGGTMEITVDEQEFMDIEKDATNRELLASYEQMLADWCCELAKKIFAKPAVNSDPNGPPPRLRINRLAPFRPKTATELEWILRREIIGRLFPLPIVARPKKRWESVTRRKLDELDEADKLLLAEVYEEDRDMYDYSEEEWRVKMEICELLWKEQLDEAVDFGLKTGVFFSDRLLDQSWQLSKPGRAMVVLMSTSSIGGDGIPLAKKCAGRCDMELGEVTQHNVQQLKRLNQALFPVSYNDKFYKDVITAGELAKLAYFNDIVVGGVCCRVDVNEQGVKRMYIMTLGTLAPYRRFGLGTIMLEHVFALCAKDPAIDSVFLHVQVNNETALDFYQRFGFQVAETQSNYYKRIEPADAYVLEKHLKGPDAENGIFPSTSYASTSTEMIENLHLEG